MPAPVDLRSDTMTAPTAAMRQAMANAVVGDDVFGEDPTVRQLEAEGAALLGKPAALFLPSGTMANQVAIHVHCRPGDELLCDERAHVYWFEGGSIARLSGTQVRPLACAGGFPSAEQIAAAVRPDDVHFPRSRLLVLENTHNMAGGRVASPARMAELAAAAHAHGLAVHVDGARLCNAAVALGCEVRELVEHAASATLCLSKGLGAPIGSLLAGDTAFVDAARRVRKAFGGGMRQAGIVAAAGLIALRDGPAQLAADHARAQRLARGLAELRWARIEVAAVETNIVMLAFAQPGGTGGDQRPRRLVRHLLEYGVLAAPAGPDRVRFVLHRDVDDEGVERCLEACRAFAAPRSAEDPHVVTDRT